MSPAVADVFFTVEPQGKHKSSIKKKNDSERQHWAVLGKPALKCRGLNTVGTVKFRLPLVAG